MKKALKKTLIVFAIALAAFILVCIGGGLYMLNYALSPGEYNEEELIDEYKAEYPQMGVWLDSLNAANAMQSITFIDENGAMLHARYVMADSATDKTAVLIHGYKDSSIMMLSIGEMYHHQLGFNILIPDLYAHGRSQGDHIRMGWLDRKSVLEWINIADSVFGGNTKMVIHGISMGGATTMMTSGENTPDCVKCFVDDCGYASVWEQFGKELEEDFGLPRFPLLYIANMFCDMKYGWDFKEASALEQVKKCNKPMLFIHGDNDDYVLTENVYSLYEAKSEPKELWIASNTDHAHAYKYHPKEYAELVKSFTDKYLK